MRLTDILGPESIRVPLRGTDRWEVIDELVDLLVEAGRLSEPDPVKQAIRQREETRTTAIGKGLAAPHGKSESCDELVMAIGKADQPIDFEAEDGQPVQIVFLLAGPPHQTGLHIQALASISRMMNDDGLRASLMSATSAQEIHDHLAEREAVLND